MDEQQYINLFFHRMQNSIETIPVMIKDIEKKFPKSFILQYYIGFYYEKVGEFEKAESKFNKSITLEPLFMPPYLSLGSYYMKTQRYKDAEECLNKVFCKKMIDMTTMKRERKINPEEQFRICSMLGFIYMNKNLKEKAENVYRKTMNILQTYCKDYKNPIYIEGMKVICLELGRIYCTSDIDKAFKIYYTGLNISYKSKGNQKYDELIHNLDKNLLNGFMLNMHYTKDIDINTDNIHKMVKKVYKKYIIPKFPDKHNNDKIHIGYLSPDFNKNAVGLFITPLLKYFNKERFEVYCYSTNPDNDEFTYMFRSYPDIHWVDVSILDNSEIYNLMKFKHKLDILVDLIAAGHSGKLDLIAMSPANIIINYLGYPGTSGLKQMTYRLTDKTVDADNEKDYTEQLLYMPRSFLCFHMFDNIKQTTINYNKKDKNDKIYMGVMNKLQKHHPIVRKIWKQIIVENDNVVLCIKQDESDYSMELLHETYKDFPKDKILFMPFSNTLENYLDLYNKIDFCLDTYPYSGTTTTCTSLYMGVPVFTIYKPGERHVSNVSGSLLKNMGMDKYIAGSLDEYKEKINQYIKEYNYHGNVEREKLSQQFLDLMNPRQFMKEYEDVLEKCIKEHHDCDLVNNDEDDDENDQPNNDIYGFNKIKYI